MSGENWTQLEQGLEGWGPGQPCHSTLQLVGSRQADITAWSFHHLLRGFPQTSSHFLGTTVTNSEMGNAAPEGPCQGDYLWEAPWRYRGLSYSLCHDMVGASTLVIVLFGNCLPLPLDCGLCFVYLCFRVSRTVSGIHGRTIAGV